MKEIEEVLYKIFRDEKVKYFQSSDAFSGIAGDTFIKYDYYHEHKARVIISIGGSNIDETPLKVCTSAGEIENLVNAIIN